MRRSKRVQPVTKELRLFRMSADIGPCAGVLTASFQEAWRGCVESYAAPRIFRRWHRIDRQRSLRRRLIINQYVCEATCT